MKLSRIVAVVFLAGLPMSCSQPPQSMTKAANDKSLVGTWFGDCDNYLEGGNQDDLNIPDPDKNPTLYTSERIDVEFTADTATLHIRSFHNSNCNKDTPWTMKSLKSSYTANVTAALADKDINQVDMVLEQLFVTPQTDNEAKIMSDEEICHFKDWKTNVVTDISKFDCSDQDVAVKIGDKAYDIYKVDGKILQFGMQAVKAESDQELRRNVDLGKKPETRPITLDPYKYKKQ